MIFGVLGCVFAVTFFALEYGKWKRKSINITREGKTVRAVSFFFMLCVFAGIFLFGFFAFMGQKKTALCVFLFVLLFIVFLLINLFIDFLLTKKKKYYLKR